jgi:nicotinamidase-related amidase
MDAVKLGFKVYIVEDAVKGVDVPIGSLQNAINTMKNKGIKFIKSEEI